MSFHGLYDSGLLNLHISLNPTLIVISIFGSAINRFLNTSSLCSDTSLLFGYHFEILQRCIILLYTLCLQAWLDLLLAHRICLKSHNVPYVMSPYRR